MKLYGSPLSPFVTRVVIGARAMGIDLPLEMPPGGMKSAEHFSLTPTGKIPCFEDGAIKLGESEVILEYLMDTTPGNSLRAADPAERAHGRLLSRFHDLYVFPPLGPLFGQMSASPRDATLIEENREKVLTGLGYIEHRLGDGPYAVGDSLGPADCTLAPTFYFIEMIFGALSLGNAFADLPRLSAWWEWIQQQPLIKEAIDAEKEAVAEFQRRKAAEAAAE